MNSYQRDMVKGASFAAGVIGIFTTGFYVGFLLGGSAESSITYLSGPLLIGMGYIGYKLANIKSENF